jgi:uncharacterized protein (DUF58 family)
MLTARGAVVLACGLALWLAARIVGSPTVHVVAVGLVVLPGIALLVVRRAQRDLQVHRRLSQARVAAGAAISVELWIENRSGASTSLLLVSDSVPSALGPPARLVLPGIPARNRQHVVYTRSAARRGRWTLGPASVDVVDPFGLARRRTQFDERGEVVVTPEVERLGGPLGPAFGAASGASRTRQLLRTGEDFYTMRPYREGDDLRRIHWRSVARTGELMIRQDESSRRSSAMIFLDTRVGAVGPSGSPAFERCVSAAASIGTFLARSGALPRLVTTSAPALLVSEPQLLDALASISHDHERTVTPTIARIRAQASADATLVFVGAAPNVAELPALLRAGAGFGARLAVLVYPQEPAEQTPERQAQLEGMASQARRALTRARWDVLVLTPSMRLADVWNPDRTHRPTAGASSR